MRAYEAVTLLVWRLLTHSMEVLNLLVGVGPSCPSLTPVRTSRRSLSEVDS